MCMSGQGNPVRAIGEMWTLAWRWLRWKGSNFVAFMQALIYLGSGRSEHRDRSRATISATLLRLDYLAIYAVLDDLPLWFL
jgi:hypothetical protein